MPLASRKNERRSVHATSDLHLTALEAFDPLVELPADVRQESIAGGTVLELPPGTVLCREGDPGDRFHLGLSGWIRIERSRSHGGATEFHLIRADSFADRPGSATQTTTEPIRRPTLGRSDLLDLIEQHPGLAPSLLRFL
jgi:CRP-like cAMP-binding protein